MCVGPPWALEMMKYLKSYFANEERESIKSSRIILGLTFIVPGASNAKDPAAIVGILITFHSGYFFRNRSLNSSAKYSALNMSTPKGRWGPCSSNGLTVIVNKVLARSNDSSSVNFSSSSLRGGTQIFLFCLIHDCNQALSLFYKSSQ